VYVYVYVYVCVCFTAGLLMCAGTPTVSAVGFRVCVRESECDVSVCVRICLYVPQRCCHCVLKRQRSLQCFPVCVRTSACVM